MQPTIDDLWKKKQEIIDNQTESEKTRDFMQSLFNDGSINAYELETWTQHFDNAADEIKNESYNDGYDDGFKEGQGAYGLTDHEVEHARRLLAQTKSADGIEVVKALQGLKQIVCDVLERMND